MSLIGSSLVSEHSLVLILLLIVIILILIFYHVLILNPMLARAIFDCLIINHISRDIVDASITSNSTHLLVSFIFKVKVIYHVILMLLILLEMIGRMLVSLVVIIDSG